MELEIVPPSCRKGLVYPLGVPDLVNGWGIKYASSPPQELIPTGADCSDSHGNQTLFQCAGYIWLPVISARPALRAPLLLAMRDIESKGSITVTVCKKGYSLAVITLSDKGSQGLRCDESGPLLMDLVSNNLPVSHSQLFLLPDDPALLRALIADLALAQKYDLIFTTGGTGLSERDITPQAIRPLLDIDLPGFTIAMLAESLKHTPHAIISRAIAGLIDKCLLVTFPGSPKAVKENLEAILPALPHALKKIHGDTTDCGV